MKDSIYQYTDRFTIKNVDGTNPVERIIERKKGTVTQEGTPLNKETILSDAAALALGVESEDPTPTDAFLQIAESILGVTSKTILYENATGISKGGSVSIDSLEEYSEMEITLKFSSTFHTCTVPVRPGDTMGFNCNHFASYLYLIAGELTYIGTTLKYNGCLVRRLSTSAVTDYSTTPNIVKIVGVK